MRTKRFKIDAVRKYLADVSLKVRGRLVYDDRIKGQFDDGVEFDLFANETDACRSWVHWPDAGNRSTVVAARFLAQWTKQVKALAKIETMIEDGEPRNPYDP